MLDDHRLAFVSGGGALLGSGLTGLAASVLLEPLAFGLPLAPSHVAGWMALLLVALVPVAAGAVLGRRRVGPPLLAGALIAAASWGNGGLVLKLAADLPAWMAIDAAGSASEDQLVPMLSYGLLSGILDSFVIPWSVAGMGALGALVGAVLRGPARGDSTPDPTLRLTAAVYGLALGGVIVVSLLAALSPMLGAIIRAHAKLGLVTTQPVVVGLVLWVAVVAWLSVLLVAAGRSRAGVAATGQTGLAALGTGITALVALGLPLAVLVLQPGSVLLPLSLLGPVWVWLARRQPAPSRQARPSVASIWAIWGISSCLVGIVFTPSFHFGIHAALHFVGHIAHFTSDEVFPPGTPLEDLRLQGQLVFLYTGVSLGACWPALAVAGAMPLRGADGAFTWHGWRGLLPAGLSFAIAGAMASLAHHLLRSAS